MNAPTRREKLRQQTHDEIKQLARAQLVSDGPQAISLRAIARQMGMAPAALYRYFPSLTDLSRTLTADLYHELANVLNESVAEIPASEPGYRIAEASRAFRAWALHHRSEFALVFGGANAGPQSPLDQPHPDVEKAAESFYIVFADLFNDLWANAPYDLPDEESLSKELRAQLAANPVGLKDELPPAARYVFLSCWIWLYGAVSTELFGHLPFAPGRDANAMFDAQLRDIGLRLGLNKEPSAR